MVGILILLLAVGVCSASARIHRDVRLGEASEAELISRLAELQNGGSISTQDVPVQSTQQRSHENNIVQEIPLSTLQASKEQRISGEVRQQILAETRQETRNRRQETHQRRKLQSSLFVSNGPGMQLINSLTVAVKWVEDKLIRVQSVVQQSQDWANAMIGRALDAVVLANVIGHAFVVDLVKAMDTVVKEATEDVDKWVDRGKQETLDLVASGGAWFRNFTLTVIDIKDDVLDNFVNDTILKQCAKESTELVEQHFLHLGTLVDQLNTTVMNAEISFAQQYNTGVSAVKVRFENFLKSLPNVNDVIQLRQLLEVEDRRKRLLDVDSHQDSLLSEPRIQWLFD